MKLKELFQNLNNKAAFIWLVILGILVAFIIGYLPRATISTNVFDLIPSNTTKTFSAAEDYFLSQLNQTLVVAIRGSEKDVNSFESELSSLPYIQSIRSKIDSDSKKVGKFLINYPYGFVSDETIAKLKEPESYARWVLSQIYSPVASASESEIEADPLLLTRQFGLTHRAKIKTKDGLLASTDSNGQLWYLFFVTLEPSLSTSEIESFSNSLLKLQESYDNLEEGKEVVYQGGLLYSNSAYELAKGDIEKLGTISVFLLVALIWIAFRSVTPIFLCLISVLTGTIVGLASTFLIFGGIHVIAAVMCLSLIGLATDYTTYFVTAMRNRKEGTSSFSVMRELRPALWHAALTTVIAYGLIILAPFPGLQQMAVFAVSGLLAACLTVVLWFPYFCRKIPPLPIGSIDFFNRYLSYWKNKKFIYCLFSALLLFVIVGISHLKLSDSLSDLQKMPENLVTQERIIKELLHQDFSQNRILVKAKSEEELVNRLEELRQLYGKHNEKDNGMIFPPLRSESIQKQVFNGAKQTLSIVEKNLNNLDIQPGMLSDFSPLGWSTFLQSDIGEPFRKTFFKSGDDFFFLIQVNPHNQELLKDIKKLDEVYIINKRAEIESIFQYYRELIFKLLGISFIVIFWALVLQFGWSLGWRAGVSLGLSILAGLAILGWTHNPLNLFSVFALIPIIGVGVDYLVVFAYLKDKPGQVLFSLVVALLSTLISLGILVGSKTTAIENFGLVLCAGIITSFISAPIVIIKNNK